MSEELKQAIELLKEAQNQLTSLGHPIKAIDELVRRVEG